jgi:fibronectin type 3 domain-containing protein
MARREFAATASIKTTLEGQALSAAIFGDRIILALPIETARPTGGEAASPETAETQIEGDEEPAESFEYGSTFAVRTSVGPKLSSEFSNIAVLARRFAPEPPGAFSLEPSPDKITLRWQVRDSDLLGFHVYRRDAQNPVYGPPLAFVPLESSVAEVATDAQSAPEETVPETDEHKEREYADRTALYGQRYIYALTAVSNRTPVVESMIAIEREVDYADRFAPSAPKNLIALAEAGRVRLLWDASPQSDVIGYSVSRRQGDESFEPLHAEPIPELEYSDRDIRSGQVYEYQVVAIDGEDNESVPSESVEARTP